MSEQPELTPWDGNIRPPIVGVICIVGFIFNGLMLIVPFFTDQQIRATLAQQGIFLTPFHWFDNLVVLVAYVGIWRMRLWGYVLYILTTLALATYNFLTHGFYIEEYVIEIIVIIILTCYIKQIKR